MTGFSVDETALDNISKNLRRQANYCDDAIGHLDKHFSHDHQGGILVYSVNYASHSIYQSIRDW